MKVNPLLVISQQSCEFILSSDVLHTEYFLCNSQSSGQILKYALFVPNVGCSDDVFFFFPPKCTELLLQSFGEQTRLHSEAVASVISRTL